MPRIRKCSICGTEFLSCNGVEVCSEECRMERKRRQNMQGNERRYTRESNVPFERECPVCGKKFETIRNVYCSEACAAKAKKKQVKEMSDLYYKENRDKILKKAKKKEEGN